MRSAVAFRSHDPALSLPSLRPTTNLVVDQRVHIGQNVERWISRQDRRRLLRDCAVALCDQYGHQPLRTPKLSLTAGGTSQVLRPDLRSIESHGSYDAHVLRKLTTSSSSNNTVAVCTNKNQKLRNRKIYRILLCCYFS